ncbi:MAG: DNA polymerase III subunit delta [Paludibacteraceae bacterium]
MVKYEELMLSLKQGKYAQVYLLCGEEPYYIDCVSNWIEHNVLDEQARAFDQTIVYGKDLASQSGGDIAPVIGAARGFAMMGGKKVIILKEAQQVKKWDALALYLDNPQPDTLLVICYKYGTPDKRQTWWKKLEKAGGVVMQSDRLRDYQVERWITEYISHKNQELSRQGKEVSIDPRVTRILAENIGTDLTAIVGALQKLIDGRPEGTKVIDAALVERNVGISKDFNVFELQSAIIDGDVLKANRIVQYFATSKDHPMIKELGILYPFFANLLLYHYMPDKNERTVASTLGINPYFVKDYARAARRYSAGKVFHIIGYIRDTDARLKGINNPSATDADLWKELMYKIMH